MQRLWFAIASTMLFMISVLAWRTESQHPRPTALTPTLTGKVEYCLTCHVDLDEISPSHPVETFGCVICHGGEPLALDADLAHASMRGGANPSDLAVVESSCGGDICHSGSAAVHRDHIQRVATSVQATYAGAIANIRYTFGEQASLSPTFAINAVTDSSSQTGITSLEEFDLSSESNPLIGKFSENCLKCHLGVEASSGEENARFTGCAACHTPLQTFIRKEGELGAIVTSGAEEGLHTLTTVISYNQCNTCHNRGNYDLRTMEFLQRAGHSLDRLYDYYQPVAQFTQCEYTLDCIDCHTRTEAMGDGDIHANQKDIEYVQCKTCHGTLTELPQTKTLTNPDDIAFTLASINPVTDLKLGDTILVTEKGEPLWNTRVLPDGNYTLFAKANGQQFIFQPVMGSDCKQDPARQDSNFCHECHALER